MTQQAEPNEGQIRTLIEAGAVAVRRHDMPILAHLPPDIVMFDLYAAAIQGQGRAREGVGSLLHFPHAGTGVRRRG